MRRRAPRSVFRVVSRLVSLLLVGWLLTVATIFGWSTRSADGTADAIVVLGAAHYAGRPSPVLKARLDQAFNLYSADRAPVVVLTGGRRDGDLISEAAAGRRYLLRRGVAAPAMRLEAVGRTSLASMHGAALLVHALHDSLRAADLATLPTVMPERPRVLLVSDPFHMLRLHVLARLHGLTPLPSPTRTSPISARPWIAVEYMLRESLALPADVMLWSWLTLTDSTAQLEH